MPETDIKGAETIATRCREAIAAAAIEHAASTVAPVVTISCGVGTIVVPPASPGVRETSDPREVRATIEAFIDRVDKGLYRAKQAGRNRIVVSESSPE